MDELEIRREIFRLLSEFHRLRSSRQSFTPGTSRVLYSGAIYDEKEMIAMTDAILGGWFGLGKYGDEFSKALTEFIGCKETLLTNSGSSASLIAISSLTSYLFAPHVKAGDEAITPACTFPTTVNPLLQNGLAPVFLDVEEDTYNINAASLEKALTEKTRLIVVPHTLGNPNDMDAIMKFAKEHNLLVVEDCCDALGSEYRGKRCGSFGVLGTLSLYPAHHITTGEGGAVFINDKRLIRPVQSFRDWGRDCWCSSTETNPLGTCGVRFNFKLGGHPYDHKYIFSHIGYNLKPTEIQAAMGTEQIKKFPKFMEARARNFTILHEAFQTYDDHFILPRSLPGAKPCWFSFPLTIRNNAPFDRNKIVNYLEAHNVNTRPIFAGNIVYQPAYRHSKFRIAEPLPNTDRIMKSTFMLGVYPGLSEEQMKYVVEQLNSFMASV